jgi:cyclic pyranopterin phosphate synthase
MADGLTHLDDEGNARMVDVGGKGATARTAVAEAVVTMTSEVKEQLLAGDLPKGDALGVARIAAIMAAKQTPHLVPLCHPIPIESIEVDVAERPTGVRIVVTARTTAKTGIEMEAMTAAAIGAVTIYDMVKGLDRSVEIGPVRLLHKSGGKSGEWNR